MNPDSESIIRRGDDAPLKALPVEPLEGGFDGLETDEAEDMLPPEPRAMRALPVGEDEVIEDTVEEPDAVEEP